MCKIYNNVELEKKKLYVDAATAGFIMFLIRIALSPLNRRPARLYLPVRDPLVNMLHCSTPVVVMPPQLYIR
jgi:hypothetical protein